MSTPSRLPIVLPPIVWLVRDSKTQWGMMGSIKAFSIHVDLAEFRLSPRLPDRQGVPYQYEHFREIENAKARAEGIREEWRKALQTPYDGQLKQA